MCPLPPGSTRPYTLVPFTTLFRSLHQRVAEGVEADGFVGDLAQRDDGILVVVPIDGQRRTRRDVPGPLRGHHDQLEAVRDLEDAIFNGYARHRTLSPLSREAGPAGPTALDYMDRPPVSPPRRRRLRSASRSAARPAGAPHSARKSVVRGKRGAGR